MKMNSWRTMEFIAWQQSFSQALTLRILQYWGLWRMLDEPPTTIQRYFYKNCNFLFQTHTFPNDRVQTTSKTHFGAGWYICFGWKKQYSLTFDSFLSSQLLRRTEDTERFLFPYWKFQTHHDNLTKQITTSLNSPSPLPAVKSTFSWTILPFFSFRQNLSWSQTRGRLDTEYNEHTVDWRNYIWTWRL